MALHVQKTIRGDKHLWWSISNTNVTKNVFSLRNILAGGDGQLIKMTAVVDCDHFVIDVLLPRDTD